MDSNHNEKSNILNSGLTHYLGKYGRFQAILNAILCLVVLPMYMSDFSLYFIALDPPWRCVLNSSICILNSTMTSANNMRCTIPREEWEYTEPRRYSIVSQFDIYCDDEWFIHLTNSLLFVGWGFGSVVLGWVADKYGRRISMIPSLFIIVIIGLLSVISPNILMFAVTRFVIGFFIPAGTYQSFVCISEVVATKHRPLAVVTIHSFSVISYLILAMNAYFIRDWKILLVVCLAPFSILFPLIFFVPESTRWLYIHGKKDGFLKLLRRISYWNKKDVPPATMFNLKEMIRKKEYWNKKHTANFVDLFRATNLMKSLIVGYSMLVTTMVYYGLTFAAGDFGGSIHLNFVLVAAIDFPGHYVCAYACGLFGRRKTVIVSTLAASLFSIGIFCVPSVGSMILLRLIFGIVGKFCIVVSTGGILIWSLESYPTIIRAQAIGYVQVMGRIGAASAPWIAKALQHVYNGVPYLVMGGLTFTAGCILFNIPETKDTVALETDVYDIPEVHGSDTEKLTTTAA